MKESEEEIQHRKFDSLKNYQCGPRLVGYVYSQSNVMGSSPIPELIPKT